MTLIFSVSNGMTPCFNVKMGCGNSACSTGQFLFAGIYDLHIDRFYGNLESGTMSIRWMFPLDTPPGNFS